jgi:hypothetical protein
MDWHGGAGLECNGAIPWPERAPDGYALAVMGECRIGQRVEVTRGFGGLAAGTQGRVVFGGSEKALVQVERDGDRPLIVDLPLAVMRRVDG